MNRCELSDAIVQCLDKCRSCSAASTDDGCAAFNQNFHIRCKIFCIHAVYGLSFVIDGRHAGVWFGDDWDGYIFFDASYDGYKLVRSDGAVDTDCVCTGCFKRNRSFDSIAAAEDTSIRLFRSCAP